MILSAERLVAFDSCPRRYKWTEEYAALRVSPLRALYAALDAGLRSEKDPERTAENHLLGLAANPGLDVIGPNVYALAMHYAKLAGVISVALRSAFPEPWQTWTSAASDLPFDWQSSCYDAGDGSPRRLVLADRWSDDRKTQELRGWRSLGETCAINQPVILTSVEIGASNGGRRHSAWTKCYRHPRNRTFRFKRVNSEEDFGATWTPVWREDSGIRVDHWLDQMAKDGCMGIVDSATVRVHPRRSDYIAEMGRIAEEMKRTPDKPDMRMAGCYGFNACPFVCVCHGSGEPRPESYGFKLA